MQTAFKNRPLQFLEDRIVDVDTDVEVMMSWEAPIMEKCAKYICENGGDILEIGFGMGICADYIQAESINSHTIVEIHPDIIAKAQEWASDKPNVTIIEGDWLSVNLDKYDGIFLDTYGDPGIDNFKDFAIDKSNSGANVTYWNNDQSQTNKYNFDNISWGFINITPPDNNYTDISSRYYMPKVTI